MSEQRGTMVMNGVTIIPCLGRVIHGEKEGASREDQKTMNYGVIECASCYLEHAPYALWPDGGRPALDPVVATNSS